LKRIAVHGGVRQFLCERRVDVKLFVVIAFRISKRQLAGGRFSPGLELAEYGQFRSNQQMSYLIFFDFFVEFGITGDPVQRKHRLLYIQIRMLYLVL